MLKKFLTVIRYYHQMTKQHGWWAISAIICFAIGNALESVLMPMFLALVLEAMKSSTSVWTPFWWLASAKIGYLVLYRIGDWCFVIYQAQSIKDLRMNSMKAIMSQSQHFFANSFSGALLARMNRFAKSFEDMSDTAVMVFLFSIVQLFGMCIVLSIKSPLLGLGVLVWSVLFSFASIRMAKWRFPTDIAEAELSSDLTATSADIIGNANTVLLFGQRREEIQRFAEENTTHISMMRKSWIYGNIQRAVQGGLTFILEIGMVAGAILLWIRGSISIADVALVYVYMRIISDTMWSIGRAFVKFTKSITDALEMVEIFEQKPEVVLSTATDRTLAIKNGSIVLEDISFSYNVGKSVFENLNLSIPHGEHIGIVGSTGAGKTTLTSILLKLHNPQQGAVLIDGHNIADIEHDLLRKQIAMVPQDLSLLHRTIFENIAYGKPNATKEEVIDAAKKARIHEDIVNLTKGYETLVGERGIKLSGGQKQRIAIARALLINAPIIVLDEATSALDAITEGQIREILQHELSGKTVIIIAHRLSTVRHCDRIIVLEKGMIKEDGSHQQLIEKEGLYADLIKHQFAQS